MPVQALADTHTITAGNMLTFTVSAADADSDPLSNITNASKGTFDPATGKYSWMPASADVGTYFWSFSSSDGWGGMASNTTAVTVSDIPPGTSYINRTIKETGTPVEGVTVSTNTSVSAATDASGFYSLAVTAGIYELTARLEPVYYMNSSVTAIVVSEAVMQDIELLIKPTGMITGRITDA